MRFSIVTDANQFATQGNQVTAQRWATILEELGHEFISFSSIDDLAQCDCLIAIHAMRCAPAIEAFHNRFPGRPIIVCLSGTDIYLDLTNQRGPESRSRALRSLDLAKRIILLEPEGGRTLSPEHRQKTVTIYQSATPATKIAEPVSTPNFEVSLIGHLRAEKDPFLVLAALKELPAHSQIRVTHIGKSLSDQMANEARKATDSSPNYRWLGALPFDQCQLFLATSKLMILTSRVEGAPSVISEAVVNMVPILATRIPASIGLLGESYPGLFEVGDSQQLAKLMFSAESDASFYRELRMSVAKRIPFFLRETERDSWRELISTLSVS